MLCKSALNDWNKGAGGGSGLETEFETWDEEKYTKYNFDKDLYDHTDVSSRPLILFDLYAKSKEPFLTVIRLWDNNAGNILCSKSNPINIGSGEVGCEDGTLNGTQNVTTSPERKKEKHL